MDLNDQVEKYISLRDLIKRQDDAHKEAMRPLRDQLDTLNAALLGQLISVGTESARCEAGTVYKTKKQSASIADGDLFMTTVIEKGLFELLDRKANVTAVADYIDEHNGSPPPGVNYSVTYVAGVRRK